LSVFACSTEREEFPPPAEVTSDLFVEQKEGQFRGGKDGKKGSRTMEKKKLRVLSPGGASVLSQSKG
jgi:hypothetical protein